MKTGVLGVLLATGFMVTAGIMGDPGLGSLGGMILLGATLVGVLFTTQEEED